MKVLQLCHKTPWPPLDGGAQAIHYTTIGLNDVGVHMNVLAVNASRKFIEGNFLPQKYRDQIPLTQVCIDTRVKPHKAFLNLFSNESYFISRFRSAAFEKKLVELIEHDNFDVIQLEHLYMCLYVDVIRKHCKAKIIFRPQNVEYIVWNRFLRNSHSPVKRLFLGIAVKRLQHFEKAIVAKTDGIIAITSDDAAEFKRINKDVDIIDIPMGFDFSRLSGYDFEKQYHNTCEIYHLGSMDWLPNLEAVTWFLKNVYPLLCRKAPHIRIHLAGNNMPAWIHGMKAGNLIIEDKITNSLQYQEHKAIMIVPLLSGSGIRAKIVEGMALGKTIISTTIGAQGIKYKKDVNIVIADTAESFCDMIIKYASSPEQCRYIGQQARILAESEYEYRNCAKKMLKFYELITHNS